MISIFHHIFIFFIPVAYTKWHLLNYNGHTSCFVGILVPTLANRARLVKSRCDCIRSDTLLWESLKALMLLWLPNCFLCWVFDLLFEVILLDYFDALDLNFITHFSWNLWWKLNFYPIQKFHFKTGSCGDLFCLKRLRI